MALGVTLPKPNIDMSMRTCVRWEGKCLMSVASVSNQRKTAMPLVVLMLLVGGVVALVLLTTTTQVRLPFLPDSEASATKLPGAFLYQQQRSLSCEYASVHIATTMTGQSVSEYEVEERVPLNENPHLGYRGNIHGEWGNTTDYGVYNTPLETALTELGIASEAFYADGERSALTTAIDRGRPTVVWLAMWGDEGSFDTWSADGTRYQLTQGMHVMVAYGYDEDGVYLTDPGTAVWQFYDWERFMAMWNVMDGMALSVHP